MNDSFGNDSMMQTAQFKQESPQKQEYGHRTMFSFGNTLFLDTQEGPIEFPQNENPKEQDLVFQ